MFVVCFCRLRESLRTNRTTVLKLSLDIIIGIIVTPWAIRTGLDFGIITMMEGENTNGLVPREVDSRAVDVLVATKTKKLLVLVHHQCKYFILSLHFIALSVIDIKLYMAAFVYLVARRASLKCVK